MPGRRSRASVLQPDADVRDGVGADLVIDFDRYVPTVLSRLVAKLRANAAGFFTQTYGVSLAEWRILSFLREHGPASAYDITSRAHLDKAFVSRETASLKAKGLVHILPVKNNARQRAEIMLSDAGVALLDRSFEDILRRHDNLTAGLDADALATFFRVVRHLEKRIVHMSDDTVAKPYSSCAPVKRIERSTGRRRTRAAM